MKKKLSLIIVLLVCLLGARQAVAQNEALDSINLQLRQLFSPLGRPNPSRLFLYDMAAHVTDSVYYQMHCPDTSNTDVWYKVYSEMYQSAYDTTAFMHPNALFWRGNSFTGDTIPIGIMDYSFYVFKPDALTTGTYFTFDTVNTHLVDKVVRPGYPYNTSQLFIAAPLVQSAVFSNPVFRIDPQFILSDMFTQSNFSGGELRIDFGDGHGWVVFDPTVVTHHQVEYTDVTDIVIKVAIYPKKGGEPLGTSATKILVGSTPQIPPDKTLHFPGLTVGVYNSCNSTGIYSGKTILYLSGFDLLDFIPALNRTPAQIYSERLAPEKIIALRNLGYNFMVVDWNQSTIDMRFNALYLVNLLDYLKQQMDPADFEQFVIMGESMGGIIGRYALAYMEDSRYEAKNTDLFFSDANDPNNKLYLGTHPEIFKLSSSWQPAGSHNTRLLITVDSPHQGANLPLSVQLAYRHVMNAFGNYIGAAIKAATTAFNLLLDSQAAQQMLIYHIDTQAGSGYKTYQRHEDNFSFYGQLQDELGGYPQHAKVVLMSSGALDGSNQPNVFTGGLRSANDRLLDFKASLFARVLWIKVPIFKGNVRALTNPNGPGHVFDAQAGFYGIRIKLKWFGIKIHIGYHPMFTWNENANVRAYCTTAGGSVGDDTALISNTPSSNGYNLSDNYWLFNLFHYSNTNDGNGCVIFDAHVGLNGFASVNTELSSCTDGTAFNFVPVQSAFDYGNMNTQPLSIDIEATNITTKLDMIPKRADAMIGLLWGVNTYHAYRREDEIYNLAGTETVYYSCAPTGEQVLRGFLNLEIGDEELYLENNTLPWHAAYSVEYDLHVNDRNPYYEYPGTPPQLGYGGMYSKKEPFEINPPNGLAEFHYDAVYTPTDIGFHFTNPNGNYVLHDTPLDHCCLNLQAGRSAGTFVKNTVTKEVTPTSLQVYPNPAAASSASVVLKYRFKQSGPVKVQIVGSDGIVRYAQELQTEGTTQEVNSVLNLRQARLTPGLYIIKLSTPAETLTGKLIIEN